MPDLAIFPGTIIEHAYIAYLSKLGLPPLTASAKPLDVTHYLGEDTPPHLDDNPHLPTLIDPRLNGRSKSTVLALQKAGFSNIFMLTPEKISGTFPPSEDALRSLFPVLAGYDDDGLIGNSPALQDLRRSLDQYAPTPYSILITGESGTGKELIAKALHRRSTRRGKPFVAINAAALQDTLAESELFGHVKGAYTGADSTTPGYFERADQGTLFFDEISRLSLSVQAKLLRAVETHTFHPVGSETPKKVDVRIIAATNQPLEELARKGQFLPDLYYRLNQLPLNMPPLRERPEDISPIATYIAVNEGIQSGKGAVLLDSTSVTPLQDYPWPGNVRQLENTLIQALVRLPEDRHVLTAQDLTGLFQTPSQSSSLAEPLVTYQDFRRYREALEKDFFLRALRAAQGNVAKAGRAIGVERRNFYKKLRDHSIPHSQS